jgi:hypothetical protein
MGRATITARILSIAGLAILMAVPAFAQDPAPPDLSGTWTLNLAKSEAQKGAALRLQSVEIESGQLDVVMTETADGKETVSTYITDGKAAPIAQVAGGNIVAKAYWKKSTLVTEIFGAPKRPNTSASSSELMIHTTQRWTLSNSGRTLTRDFDDAKQVFVYDLR